MSNRIYWPNCSVCQYMKKNADFRFRIMQSSYFHEGAHESPAKINKSFGMPFKTVTLYAHLNRHQKRDRIKAPMPIAVPEVVNSVEATPITTTEHEMGLDEFIREGRAKLARREMQVTASTYLQAIKTKAEIEKSTKDRRLEAIKAFFTDGKPQKSSLPEGQSQN